MTDFKPSITNEEIEELPVGIFSGKIHLIEDLDSVNYFCKRLMNYPVLGFDSESKAAFKKGIKNKPSLVQFSIANEAFLFRINKVGLNKRIIDIFENPSIIKAGAALHQDIKELQALYSFKPSSFVDIQTYSNKFGIIDNSLKKLAAIVLGYKISKSQRLSNWSSEVLTESQLIYAATDAWVSFKIYEKLIETENNEQNYTKEG